MADNEIYANFEEIKKNKNDSGKNTGNCIPCQRTSRD